MEVWKDIKDYEGIYQISNFGNVKSYDSIVSRGIVGDKFLVSRILKQSVSNRGYIDIGLTKNNKQKRFYIHRLIAIAFIPNKENKKFVNHKNAIKTDNSISNLEWCTPKENSLHSLAMKLQKFVKGEEHGNAKLSKIKVIEIKRLLNLKVKNVVIAEKFDIHPNLVSDIKTGKSWKHIK